MIFIVNLLKFIHLFIRDIKGINPQNPEIKIKRAEMLLFVLYEFLCLYYF